MNRDIIEAKYFHLKGFFDKSEVANYLTIFDDISSSPSFPKPHKHITELCPNRLKENIVYFNLCKKIHAAMRANYEVDNLDFINLWLVETKPVDADPNVLPYKLHFDGERRIKGMVYLHDLKLQHGPIHLGKCKSEVQIEEKRKKLSRNYSSLSENIVAKEDLDGSVQPMVGGQGDLILFDTNVPHYAGIVKEGYERKVLRFDFEHPSFFTAKDRIKRQIKTLIKEFTG